ncbi:MAG: formylglycine-generating enzyme family protein [Verrucomicrobia bacterium]|nr:formylglycine-generating enzyme family protein [Verrucomicrobiota bacterium]
MALALTGAVVYAAEPTIDYSLELKLTYTGVLYQSTDGVNWTKVEGATSPYYVPVEDAKKMLFCSKDEEEQPGDSLIPGENGTIPLSGTVSLDINWISVSRATFLMGSPKGELGRFIDEAQHQVTLTCGYWMGKYEVTQAQYEAIMGKNPSYFKGADLPVEQVTWYDAMTFCAKLTEQERAAGRLPEGYEYTLPTESQWEYACRAGTVQALNNGKNLSNEEQCPEMDEVGWYVGNSDGMTHPVGQKKPNARGLYDMHGNVHEWCLDWYDLDYPDSAVMDPIGTNAGSKRVLRGGCWSNEANGCRSAYRGYADPEFDSSRRGFRVALAPVWGKNRTITLPGNVELDMIGINPGAFRMIGSEPGAFLMGSPKDELGRENDETQHEVTLTKAYWLGKYEVTQAQYEAIMGTNPSYFKGADLPVEQVTWYDAMEFCEKLTEIERAAGRLPEGYEYTLPTEAQWEYAYRAGTTTALNNGKDLSDYWECPEMDEVGWYVGNSDGMTHPVGQKKPNAWGLYDMHGNVYEWCSDWYDFDYPTEAVTDPAGPISVRDEYRVMRGGGWDHDANYCRSAYRGRYNPDSNYRNRGFRVALAPVQ